MNTSRKALVLGATGGAGGEIAAALLRRGWQVRALVRDTARPQLSTDIEWIAGDAMRADDVMQAASGVEAIVHAVNPPGYRDWDKLVLPMLDHTIAANQLLPECGPKKSPQRRISERTPSAAACCRRRSSSTRIAPLRVSGRCGEVSPSRGNASGP